LKQSVTSHQRAKYSFFSVIRNWHQFLLYRLLFAELTVSDSIVERIIFRFGEV
jgi:hypothetical protein